MTDPRLGGLGELFGLRRRALGRALLAALARGDAAASQLLVNHHQLARWLNRHGARAVVVTAAPRRRKKATPPQVVAMLGTLPFADARFDAVCVCGTPPPEPPVLMECARTVRDGGLVAVATPAGALFGDARLQETLAARMVHAGLVDVEQTPLAGMWLTLGTTRHFGHASEKALPRRSRVD